MKIYHSPLFYAHVFFAWYFVKNLCVFTQEASTRNDGSLILVIVLAFAGILGLGLGLLLDLGIRGLPLSHGIKTGLLLLSGLLLAIGWYRGSALLGVSG